MSVLFDVLGMLAVAAVLYLAVRGFAEVYMWRWRKRYERKRRESRL